MNKLGQLCSGTGLIVTVGEDVELKQWSDRGIAVEPFLCERPNPDLSNFKYPIHSITKYLVGRRVIGISHSHRLIWHEIARRDDERFVLVLESDATAESDFLGLIDFEKELGEAIEGGLELPDLIALGGLFQTPAERKVHGGDLSDMLAQRYCMRNIQNLRAGPLPGVKSFEVPEVIAGTHAYMLRRSGARKLLDRLPYIFNHVDWEITFVTRHSDFSAWSTTRRLIRNGGVHIREADVKPEALALTQLWRLQSWIADSTLQFSSSRRSSNLVDKRAPMIRSSSDDTTAQISPMTSDRKLKEIRCRDSAAPNKGFGLYDDTHVPYVTNARWPFTVIITRIPNPWGYGWEVPSEVCIAMTLAGFAGFVAPFCSPLLMLGLTMGSKAKDSSSLCILIGLGVYFCGPPLAGVLLAICSVLGYMTTSSPGLDYAPCFREAGPFDVPLIMPTFQALALLLAASSPVISTAIMVVIFTLQVVPYVERAWATCSTALRLGQCHIKYAA